MRRSSSSKSGSGGNLSVNPLSGPSEEVGRGYIGQAVQEPPAARDSSVEDTSGKGTSGQIVLSYHR